MAASWTSVNGAACGGPAANSQIGGPVAPQGEQRGADGAEAAARHHIDLLAGLPGAIGQDLLPAAPVVRVGRLGGIEPRQVPSHARALRIVGVVRGDHVQARRKALRFRTPVAESPDEDRAGRIGQHQVEAAPAAGIQCGDGRRGVIGGAVRQRQQRQLAPASLAGGGAEAARPVQHRGHHAGAVHPHPGAAARAVAPGNHVRLIRPMGGGRIPGPVQHFVAIGGQDERPGVTGTDQQDDGAHWIDYDSGRAKGNGQAFEHLRHQLVPRRRCLGTPSTYLK